MFHASAIFQVIDGVLMFLILKCKKQKFATILLVGHATLGVKIDG